jgi:hypothetical protein
MSIQKKIRLLPYVFIFAVLLLVSGCTGAHYALLDPVPGKISGTILDEESNPVQNAYVRLENAVHSSSSVLTDANGSFSLPEMTPGVYDLVAEKKIDGIEYRARIRYINVHEESLIFRDLKLRPAGRISGRVLLEGATNYSGVLVQLLGTQKSVTTGADGSYEFDELAYSYRDSAAGIDYRYTLKFTKDMYGLQTVRDITVAAGELTVIPDVEMENLDPSGIADVTGSVRLEAQNGAQGALIRLLGTNVSEEILSSLDSGFTFRNVPVGSYVIEVSHDDYYRLEQQFTIAPGQTLKDLGELLLTNVEHFATDKMAVDMVLSPSSRQIAYAKYAPSDSYAHREIYVMDIEGSNFDTRISYLARVAEDKDSGMSWSADGDYLLYVEEREKTHSRRYRLQVIPSSGGTNVNLTDYMSDIAQPAFSPYDLRFVWMEHNDEPTAGIMVGELVKKTSGLQIENKERVVQVYNDIPGDNKFSSIEFGASDRILFCKDNPTGSMGTAYGINTVPVNAGDNTGLIFPIYEAGNANSVTYGPQYDRIAYAISSGTDAGIYIANLDGTSRERISVAYGRALNISADGKMIYFIDRRSAYNRRIARLKIPQKWQY